MISQDKLAKILALATNNPSRAEAEAALLKAQALMLESPTQASWLLDLEPIVEVEVCRDVSPWFVRLGDILGSNFRVVFMVDRAAGTSYILGYKADTAIARTVILAARRMAQQLAAEWWYQHPDESQDSQTSFLHGFATGVEERLNNQVAEQGAAMALRRDPRLEQYLENLGYKSYIEKVPTTVDQSTYTLGYEAGTTHETLPTIEDPGP